MGKISLSILWFLLLVLPALSQQIDPAPEDPEVTEEEPYIIEYFVPDDFFTIQAAIDSPDVVDGCVITVRPGTYEESIAFSPVAGPTKAITVRSKQGPEVTVIHGMQSGDVVTFRGDEKLDTVLDGFTLRNGRMGIYCYVGSNSIPSSPTIKNNIITGNAGYSGNGAISVVESSAHIIGNEIYDNSCSGIFFSEGNPTISGNTIKNNTASSGGGIQGYAYLCSATITNNDIIDNTATTRGGGVHIWYGTSVVFSGNTVSGNSGTLTQGGGVWWSGGDSCILSDNIITENTSAGGGGGLQLSGHVSLAVSGNMISGNTAMNGGGGVYWNSSDGKFCDNIVDGNMTDGYGGGIWASNWANVDPPVFKNNLIINNEATRRGGGIYSDAMISGNSLFLNNTIVGNRQTELNSNIFNGGGGLYCASSDDVVADCIFWANEAAGFYGDQIMLCTNSPTLTISHSDVQDGKSGVYVHSGSTLIWDDLSMINADPLFTTGSDGDYYLSHLAAGQGGDSPCVDTGSDTASNLGLDTYTTRTDRETDEGMVDMGYHYSAAPSVLRVPSEYATIQAAINAAWPKDTVLVAPDTVNGGPYYENIDLLGKAILVTSEQGASKTTIDGSRSGSVVTFSGGEGADTVLEGFTVTNGSADQGSGIYCADSTSPTIRDNVIEANSRVWGQGGGIYCADYAAPEITKNTIAGNSVYFGGGIYCCPHSSPSIRNNTISDNIAGETGEFGEGGGIWCGTLSSPIIANNRITENISEQGGGIYCLSDGGVIEENAICWNQAVYFGIDALGGGILLGIGSTTNLNNNLICGNSSEYWGGGVFIARCSATLTNNTIVGNTASAWGGGLNCTSATTTVVDTIFWDNEAPVGPEISLFHTVETCELTISYSDVEGGQGSVYVYTTGCVLNWLSGMKELDPLFVTGPLGDYYLSQVAAGQGSDSPCVDQGSDTASNLGMDLYTTRTDGAADSGVVDMGYHYARSVLSSRGKGRSLRAVRGK